MLHTHVKGGTGAGRKRAPKPQNKKDWDCDKCGARCKFFWRNCPNCGAKQED